MATIMSSSVTSTAYKITRTVVGIKCDICGKTIPTEKFRRDITKYYEVTTGHHDWGYESAESIETIDICPDCLIEYITEYLKDASTTGYLTFETKYSYPKESSHIVDTPPKEGEITEEEHDYY